VFVRVGEPDEQRPPVIDQGHHARHDPAVREILGGYSGPLRQDSCIEFKRVPVYMQRNGAAPVLCFLFCF
jgi:hypothetical protein